MGDRLLRVCLALLFFSFGAMTAFGQASTGQISGVVTDESGAVVSGATVTVTEKGTGAKRTVTTTESGNYTVPLLPPGVYSVEVSAPNFRKTTLNDVLVRITEDTNADITLQVGDAGGETVVVTAESPLVRTDISSNGRVIEERSLRQLPLPTRNFQQLLTLSTGASSNITNTSEVGRGDTSFNVNGQRSTSNSVLINGIDANSIGTNSTPNLAVPATDTLQEFIVLTSQYDASNGRNVGGVVTAITKSGSNEFHGNAYYFVRNRSLNANDFFLNREGIAKPKNDRNQYGGTFGGRIIKDKVFFFGSYQGTRETNGTSRLNSLAVVGTAPDLTDDRSDAALATLVAGRAPNFAALPVANRVALINPVTLAMLRARYPDGSFLIPSGNGRRSRTLGSESKFDEDQFNANVDAQLTNNNRLSVKFFFANNSTRQGLFSQFGLANALQTPGYPVDLTANNRLLTVTDTHVFANGIVNEARFGFNMIPTTATPNEPFTAAQFGITTPNQTRFPGMPAVALQNLFTVGPAGFSASDNQADTTTFGDTVTLVKGNHTLKFGGEFRYNRVRVGFDIFARGSVTYTGALAGAFRPFFGTPTDAGILATPAFNEFLFTGTVFAVPGVGNVPFAPQVSIIGPGAAAREIRSKDVGLFIQDDWKVNNRLTVNLGLRYDYFGPFFDTNGRFVTYDPSIQAAGQTGTLNGFFQADNARTPIPGIPQIDRSLIPSDKNNFGPRVGFALKPFDSDRFVLRGGYGVYFDRGNARSANNQGLSFPYYTLAVSTFNAARPFSNPFVPIPQTYPPNLAAGLPFRATDNSVIPVQGIYPSLLQRTPYIQQYSLGFQWEFIKDTQLEVQYVGSQGRKLTRFRNANPSFGPSAFTAPTGFTTPVPNTSLSGLPVIGFGVHIQETSANSNYNSLQVSLTRRLAKGLQGLVAYTWQHTIDDYSGQLSSAGTSDVSADFGDQGSFRGIRGTSDFDRRHRIVGSFVYDLPKIYKGDSLIGKLFLNDWQVAGVTIFQTGLPFSVITAGSLFDASRADVAAGFSGDANLGGDVRGRLERYFNTAAFVAAANRAGNFGTSGRNLLRGPAQANTDISIVKFFPIRERQRFEFRTEFFNAFNQVNFANPVSVVQNINYGRVLSTATGPRIIQFAIKFAF